MKILAINLLRTISFFMVFSLIPKLNFGQENYITKNKAEAAFTLVDDSELPSLFIATEDYKGVKFVAEDLSQDIKRVSGKLPEIDSSGTINSKTAIIIGTLGKSRYIDKLVENGKLDLSDIKGKWEAFSIQVIENPMPNVDKALVIAGSDKRGTIYGMYDVSEKIGVSPWYWWADVPAKKADILYVKAGKFTEGSPKVKYRGIFINDEEPGLGNWAREKFGGINNKMYTKVFELILRLKGNYLWPAMWGKAFNEDDSLNPILANDYGIVMGTSHHEPMMRAQEEWTQHGSDFGNGEWNYKTNKEGLQQFWSAGFSRNQGYENMVTIGMRGDGDKAMTEGTAIDLLENIVADQRDIIEDVTGKPAAETPQVWALYKEVQDYYDQGMRVPDDVTLLLSDDNWGNIRKLPDPEEKPRAGGYGIYYHFDYVGGPRSYKWINSSQISRVWEQMHLAYTYNATEIWIVNVGDLKPMEFPISFFLDYAWNPEKIKAEDLENYTVNWAEQQFPIEYAQETADLLQKYTKYNSRRKPELLSPKTYSLTNFNEAETVLKEFSELEIKAEEIYKKLPQEYKDAFYQLVLFPVKASANINRLYIAAAKNNLYAKQGRASANKYAKKVQEYFQKDKELTNYYHNELADGKWNHMMAQTHIGYTNWQEPKENKAPKTTKIDLQENAEMGVAIEGSKEVWPQAKQGKLPAFDSYNDQQHYVDIFNKGKTSFKYQIEPGKEWITLSSESGSIEDEKRILVSIDWKKAPKGKSEVPITFNATGKSVKILLKINNLSAENVNGFVQNDAYISIPATGYSKKTNGENAWLEIPNLGKTGSSMTSDKIKPGKNFNKNNPSLTYNFYTFDAGEMNIEFTVSPTLDFLDRGGLRFAYSVNGADPKILNIQKDTKDDWGTSVSNNATSIKSTIKIEKEGAQKLTIWAVDPGIVLQKIVINTGETKDSYLGPESSTLN